VGVGVAVEVGVGAVVAVGEGKGDSVGVSVGETGTPGDAQQLNRVSIVSTTRQQNIQVLAWVSMVFHLIKWFKNVSAAAGSVSVSVFTRT